MFRESLGYTASDFLVVYSGNLGRAHILTPILDLAARFEKSPRVKFLIIGEGAQKQHLQENTAARSLDNVAFHPAVPLKDLAPLLRTADVHLVTIRPECSGTVLPSKFYGVIEARKPIIFIGPADSEIAQSILEHDIGAVCSPNDVSPAVEFLQSVTSEHESLLRIQSRVDEFALSQPGLGGAIAEWTNILLRSETPLSSEPGNFTSK